MILSALYKSIALCLFSIVIEAISATKTGRKWFESLKQPKYSFSLRVWYVVGAIYYVIFGVAAYRQFEIGKPAFSTSIILLALVMILNGLSNFVIFKYRSIKWFYLIIYPFGVLLGALIMVLWKDDKISATLVFLYFIWLFYDLYYGYNLWRLNEPI